MGKRKRFGLNKQVAIILIFAMLITFMPFNHNQAEAADESDFGIVWSSVFGGAGHDEAFSVIAVDKANEEDTTVEGYVLSGTVSDEAGLEYTALIKTDKAGTVLWEKKFGGIFRSSGRSVSRTSDGGYIIAGTSKTYMESYDKVYIIKTDADGNLQWERKLDLEAQGYMYSKRQGFSVKEAEGGGYIIAGAIIRGDSSDALIIRTDSQGIVKWAKLMGGQQWEWLYDVEPIPGGYIVAGSTEKDNKYYEYLVRITDAGEVIWEHTGSVPGAQFKNLSISEDGTLVATGYRSNNISVCKFDIDKTFYWENSYDAGIGYSSASLENGNYVIAGNDKIICLNSDGKKLWGKDLNTENSFVKGVAISGSGSMVFAGSKNQNGMDICLFELATDRASLGVSALKVLKKGTIYLYSPVYLKDGKLDKTGNVDVRAKIIEGEDETVVQLYDGFDSAKDDDFEYQDGVYTGSYKVKGTTSVKIELYVDGIKEDSETVEVISDPDLVVLTDYKKLYKEFIDTGMTAEDDKNSNRKPDFYDLMERIKKYAQDQKGIIADPSKEISIDNNWTTNYSDFTYETDARAMSESIDTLIKGISDISRFDHVAIIGDDEVIPFYRKNDKSFDSDTKLPYESSYVPDDLQGKYYGNPTLKDTKTPYIMTDIVYGSYNNTDPDTVDFPVPDAGVGRIFADSPVTLINMINGFETPVNLIPEQSKALVFGLDNDLKDSPDGVNFPRSIKNAVIPVLKSKYKKSSGMITPPYKDGYYYWYDGTLRDWNGDMVKGAIEASILTMLWSHARHDIEMTQGFPTITSFTFQNMKPSPGHIFINAGCHSGYSVSHNNKLQPGESYNPYDKAMVNQIISKQVGYMAPSTYGLGANGAVIAHDLLESKFLNALLNFGGGTVGQRLVNAYWDYRTDYGYTSNKDSIYAAYGTIYYGLTTQKTVTSGGELAVLQSEKVVRLDSNMVENAKIAVIAGAESVKRSLSVSIDVPVFKQTADEQGKAIFEIPNNSNFTKTSFAPMLPVISKTYVLPKGSTVNGVALEKQTMRQLDEPIDLQTLNPVNKTLGTIEGSMELSNPYPAQIYSWNQEERADGVYLNIMLTPIQYNPQTKQVTLYESIDLKVDYSTPEGNTNIAEVVTNGGSAVEAGAVAVPVNVKINSGSDQTLEMEWMVRDSSGLVIKSGVKPLSLIAGENQAAFTIDTTGWELGNKDFTVSLKGESLLASHFSVISLTGLSLSIQMQERNIDPVEGKAVFIAEVRDESGMGKTGLVEGEFIVTVDEAIQENITVSELGGGSYSFELPISGLSENIHRLKVICRKAEAEEDFVVRTDTRPPVVSKTVPSQYMAGVTLEPEITLEFDEIIFSADKYDDIRLVTSGVEGDIDIGISKTIEYSKLIIKPSEPLEYDTIYKVDIPVGAVADKKENKTALPFSLKFITYAQPDTILPSVISVLPENGTTDFPAQAAVIVNFSESIGPGAKVGEIRLTANDKAVDFNIKYYASELILTPIAALPFNASCKVTLPAGSINDLSGNALLSEFSFEFSIENGPDVTAPAIVSVLPGQGDEGVLTDACVTIKFDEIILTGEKISEIKLTDFQGTPISFTVDAQRDTLTVTTEKNLEINKQYKIIIPSSAVKDMAGNPLVENSEFTFNTGKPADSSCPQVIETAPSDKAEGVLVNSKIFIYYDEAIMAGANYGEIAIYEVSGKTEKAINTDISINGKIVIVTPDEVLKYVSAYKVIVPAGAIKDLNENDTATGVVFQFATAIAPDTAPPVLQSTSPLSGAQDVPTDTQIVYTFDEILKKGSSFNNIKISQGANAITFASTLEGKKLILSISGLANSTDITVSVPAGAVSDLMGNSIKESCDISFKTIAASSGGNPGGNPGGIGNGTGTGGNTGTEENGNIIVKGIINSVEQPIVNTTGRKDAENNVIPIIVDDKLLNEKLKQEKEKAIVSIIVESTENCKFSGITGQTVKNMELREAVLEVNTGLAIYSVPAELFNIDRIADSFRENTALKDIEVSIKISSADNDNIKMVEKSARNGEFQIVVPPVEFSIECSYGGRIIEVDRFTAPVKSLIPIPEGVDPDNITTAITVEKNGTVRHVATKIIEINGTKYVQITSFTNGIYTIIENKVEFKDVSDHWSREFVNEMGSRLIVSGIGKGIFKPNNDLTRAELAAIIVGALGLKASGNSEKFADVEEGKWYSEAVNAAREYGIVSGYNDNTFRPMQKITREESIVMISKAMSMLGTSIKITEAEIQSELKRFDDGGEFAGWSRKDAAYLIKHKLLVGSGGKLKPRNNITRAEAATIMLKALRISAVI